MVLDAFKRDVQRISTALRTEIICIRCGERPAEFQRPHWLPICRECNKEIFKLPHTEMFKEMKRLWDKFSP